MATKYKLTDGKMPSTPLPGIEIEKYSGQADAQQIKNYQQKVGSLLYTAIMIRPDVAYAAAMLSQFLTNPGPKHFVAVDWTIRYLFGSRFLAIVYGGEPSNADFLVASDASFADDPDTRRSSQGYIILLFGGAIIWKAVRQSTVTTSSIEAELLALTFVGKEAIALKRFFLEIQLDLGKIWEIFCDNQQTIRLVVGANERITTKLRHIDIHNLWLRQEHAKGSFEITYLPTADMPADGLTKNLPRYKFEHFRALLHLDDIRGLVEKLAEQSKLF